MRQKGLLKISANFEVQSSTPLDARLIVDTIDDLTDINSWKSTDNNVYITKGFPCVVANDSDTKSGLYILRDNDFTNISNWEKVGDYIIIDNETNKDTIRKKDGLRVYVRSSRKEYIWHSNTNKWEEIAYSPNISVVEVTFDQLFSLIQNNQLVIDQPYMITDYRTYSPLSSTPYPTTPTPLIVTARTNSSLFEDAYDINNPLHIVKYSYSIDLGDYGAIIYRKEPISNIEANFDFVNLRVAISKLNIQYYIYSNTKQYNIFDIAIDQSTGYIYMCIKPAYNISLTNPEYWIPITNSKADEFFICHPFSSLVEDENSTIDGYIFSRITSTNTVVYDTNGITNIKMLGNYNHRTGEGYNLFITQKRDSIVFRNNIITTGSSNVFTGASCVNIICHSSYSNAINIMDYDKTTIMNINNIFYTQYTKDFIMSSKEPKDFILHGSLRLTSDNFNYPNSVITVNYINNELPIKQHDIINNVYVIKDSHPLGINKKMITYVFRKEVSKLSQVNSGEYYVFKFNMYVYNDTRFFKVYVIRKNQPNTKIELHYGSDWKWDNEYGTDFYTGGAYNLKFGILIRKNLNNDDTIEINYYEIVNTTKYHIGFSHTNENYRNKLTNRCPSRLIFDTNIANMMKILNIKSFNTYERVIEIEYAAKNIAVKKTKKYIYPNIIFIKEIDRNINLPSNLQIEIYSIGEKSIRSSNFTSDLDSTLPNYIRLVSVIYHPLYPIIYLVDLRNTQYNKISISTSKNYICKKGKYIIKVRNLDNNEITEIEGIIKMKLVVIKQVHPYNTPPYKPNRFLGKFTIPTIV